MKKITDFQIHSLFVAISLALVSFAQTGCGNSGGGTGTGNPDVTEDTSTSGVVASAIGGALSSSSSGGTLAFNVPALHKSSLHFPGHFPGHFLVHFSFIPSAYASTSCPTYKSAQGAGCTASGSTFWLTYDDCNFGSSTANWYGFQSFTLSSGSAECGTFPDPGDNGTLSLQYVSGSASTTAATALLTTEFGTLSTIDDHTTNLGNFDGDTISSIFSDGGYGAQVGYNSTGKRDSLYLAHRLTVVGVMNHSVYTPTPLTVSETSSTTRNVSGQVTVYHNLLQVVGTSQLTNVVHEDGCCLPISGSIRTTFAAGSDPSKAPTAAGQLMIGKSETLTFTGCRTATLQTYDGNTQNVSLSRCF